MSNAIAIIPARGGSRRIPRKNIRDFFGRPILANAIEIARESGVFREIYVSTDDAEIVEVARAYGASVHHRAAEFAHDEVGTQEVTANALHEIGFAPELACCIYPCCTVHALALERAWKALTSYPQVDYIYACDQHGNDVGQFYMGRSRAFLGGVPLEGHSSRFYATGAVDVNTEADWLAMEARHRAKLASREARAHG